MKLKIAKGIKHNAKKLVLPLGVHKLMQNDEFYKAQNCRLNRNMLNVVSKPLSLRSCLFFFNILFCGGEIDQMCTISKAKVKRNVEYFTMPESLSCFGWTG